MVPVTSACLILYKCDICVPGKSVLCFRSLFFFAVSNLEAAQQYR